MNALITTCRHLTRDTKNVAAVHVVLSVAAKASAAKRAAHKRSVANISSPASAIGAFV